MVAVIPSIASALVSFCALVLSLISYRATRRRYGIEDADRLKAATEQELRKADVLAWANKCIEQLQSLELTILMRPVDANKRYIDIAFKTSCLNESGRLLFKNTHTENFGVEKPPAYRGFRPIILDQLIIAHQIACRAEASEENTLRRFHALSRQALQQFVSLAQDEVGRSRVAARTNEAAGSGINIEYLSKGLSEKDLFSPGRRYL